MKMEDYESFDDFVSAQSDANQKLVSKLRQIVNKVAPELEETVKWGNGCWLYGKLPVIFVHCKKDYTQLGFFGGSQLEDPDNLLKGDAKYVRHIKVETEDDIDENALSLIIRQASKHDYKASS